MRPITNIAMLFFRFSKVSVWLDWGRTRCKVRINAADCYRFGVCLGRSALVPDLLMHAYCNDE